MVESSEAIVKKDLPFDGVKPEDVFFAMSLGEGTLGEKPIYVLRRGRESKE